jgi:hypothetical protein
VREHRGIRYIEDPRWPGSGTYLRAYWDPEEALDAAGGDSA